jgi:hypothetical protein
MLMRAYSWLGLYSHSYLGVEPEDEKVSAESKRYDVAAGQLQERVSKLHIEAEKSLQMTNFRRYHPISRQSRRRMTRPPRADETFASKASRGISAKKHAQAELPAGPIKCPARIRTLKGLAVPPLATERSSIRKRAKNLNNASPPGARRAEVRRKSQAEAASATSITRTIHDEKANDLNWREGYLKNLLLISAAGMLFGCAIWANIVDTPLSATRGAWVSQAARGHVY